MISTIIDYSIREFGPTAVIATSILAGAVCYPLIMKISKIALNILRSFREWFSSMTFSIRMHSLICDECAQNHKRHMYEAIPTK